MEEGYVTYESDGNGLAGILLRASGPCMVLVSVEIALERLERTSRAEAWWE